MDTTRFKTLTHAFTLIEIVFVLLIGGIIAYMSFSNVAPDPLRVVSNQIIRHINYARHLAIKEEKFDPQEHYYANSPQSDTKYNGFFFRSYWSFRFANNGSTGVGWAYAVYSDTDRNSNIDMVNHTEATTDPLSQKYLDYGQNYTDATKINEQTRIEQKYGINSVTFTNCQNTTSDSINFRFNNLGQVFVKTYRPSQGTNYSPYQSRLMQDCLITLTHISGRKATITLTPETGFSYLSSLDPE